MKNGVKVCTLFFEVGVLGRKVTGLPLTTNWKKWPKWKIKQGIIGK